MKIAIKAIAENSLKNLGEVIAQQEVFYEAYLQQVFGNLGMSPEDMAEEVINNESSTIFKKINGKEVNDERLLELVMVLQKHIDDSGKDKKGERRDFVKEFLEKNSDVDLKSHRYQEHKFCALESAVLTRNHAIIKTLLDFGAEFNDAISDQVVHPLLIAHFLFKDEGMENILRENGAVLSPKYATELAIEALSSANFLVMEYCINFLSANEINRQDVRIGGSIFGNVIFSSYRSDVALELTERLVDINSDILNVRRSGNTVLEDLAATNFADQALREDLVASASIMDHMQSNNAVYGDNVDESKWADGTEISNSDKEKIIKDAKKRLFHIVEKVVNKAQQLSNSSDQFNDYINHKLSSGLNALIIASCSGNQEVADFLLSKGARITVEDMFSGEKMMGVIQSGDLKRNHEASQLGKDIANSMRIFFGSNQLQEVALKPSASKVPNKKVAAIQEDQSEMVAVEEDVGQKLKKLDLQLKETARSLQEGINPEISAMKDATPTQLRLARELIDLCKQIVQFQKENLENDLVKSKLNGTSEQELENFRNQWSKEVRQSNIREFVTDRGFTLLHLVAKFGDAQGVKYLLEDFGVDPNRIVTEQKIEKKSAKSAKEVEVKKSALYFAVTQKNNGLKIIESILSSDVIDREIVKGEVATAIGFGLNPALKLLLADVKTKEAIASEKEMRTLINQWQSVANGIREQSIKNTIKASINNFDAEMQRVFRPSKTKNNPRSRTQSVVTDSESLESEIATTVSVDNPKIAVESSVPELVGKSVDLITSVAETVVERAENFAVESPEPNFTEQPPQSELVINTEDFDFAAIPKDLEELLLEDTSSLRTSPEAINFGAFNSKVFFDLTPSVSTTFVSVRDCSLVDQNIVQSNSNAAQPYSELNAAAQEFVPKGSVSDAKVSNLSIKGEQENLR